MSLQPFTDDRAHLGESPVWSAAENALYWVDILGRRIYRTDPETRKSRFWEMPSMPGMIALRRDGGLVAALQDGIYAVDTQTGAVDRLVPLEADQPGNRANDGKCDAAGRLWVGTMNIQDSNNPTGSFYRVDPDLNVTRVKSEVRVPNGLAWSPDDAVMYWTDSRSNVLSTWAFDPATGDRTDETPYYHFDRAKTGSIDGAAMDAEGNYWAVLYRGGVLIRLSPSGEELTRIELPVPQPTMPAFGGTDMKTIFITSASQQLDDAALAAAPLSGALFAIDVDVPGCPVHDFGG